MDDAMRETLLQRRADMVVNDRTGTPGQCRWYWAAWCAYDKYPDTVSVHQSGRARTKREAQQQAKAAMPRIEAAWKALLGGEPD
jgi:hypothetical protein